MNEELREKLFKVLFPYSDVKRASDNEMIDQILNAIEQDGYRKAIGKPKLLSDEELDNANAGYEYIASMIKQGIKNALEAQLNVCIKHYEGGE